MRRLPKDRWKTSICRAIEIWCVISSGKSNGVDFELHKILIHCDATNITRVASKCGEKYLKYSERLTLSQSVLQCNDMTLKCCDSTNASCDKFISLWEPIWMFNLCPQWDDDSAVTTMLIMMEKTILMMIMMMKKKTMMMMKKMMMMIGRLCIQDCPTAPSEEREVVGAEVWN